MSSINWEQKYKNLRANFLKSLDVSYRSGYEQGFNDASMEAIAQQAQMMQRSQAQMQQVAAQQAPQNMGVNPEEQRQAAEAQSEGSELDSQISTLESLVNKSEAFSPDLKKTVSKIKTDVLGLQNMFNQNLSTTQKNIVSAQEKMVNDIVQKWQSEQDGLSKDIASVLGTQFIIKE